MKKLMLICLVCVCFKAQAIALSVASRGHISNKCESCHHYHKVREALRVKPENFIDYNPKPTIHPMPWLLPKQATIPSTEGKE